MSNRQSWAVIAVAAAAVTLASMVTLTAQQSGGNRPAVIAVVDVQRVFNSLEEKAQVEADITQQLEKLQREEQDKQTEVRALESDLRILAPDSDAFKQTQNKLEQKLIELQVWKQFRTRQLESEKAIRIEDLYRKLIDAVERIAKRSNFDLVLFKDQTESLRGQNQQQLAMIIQSRKVLYSASEMDVTDQVLQLCNNEWNARKGGSPAKQP